LRTKEPEYEKEKVKKEFNSDFDAIIPPDIHLSIHATLEDVYKKMIKVLRVKVLRNNIMETITLYVPLIDYKDKCIFENLGDNKKSNIIVTIILESHETIYTDDILDTYDLSMEVLVTLYEYYFAKNKNILFLNNEIININLLEHGNNCITIQDKGLWFTDENDNLKRGNLHIFIKVKLPENVSIDTQNFLSEYFNDGTNKKNSISTL
jgi:DnaJ-class molecular chaperone